MHKGQTREEIVNEFIWRLKHQRGNAVFRRDFHEAEIRRIDQRMADLESTLEALEPVE